MSGGYERYNRRSRTRYAFWVPLLLTTTVATAGLAAWVWTNRPQQDPSSDDDEHLSFGEDESMRPHAPHRSDDDGGKEQLSQPQTNPQGRDPPYQQQGQQGQQGPGQEEGFMSRMSGAVRRTPSPQQLLDGASRRVAAGVAAAGAAVGGALSAIREETPPNDHFGDQTRWSEEADMKRKVDAQSSQSAPAVATHTEAFTASSRGAGAAATASSHQGNTQKKRIIAVVISADIESYSQDPDDKGSLDVEHMSFLSHITPPNPETTTLVILIYAPSQKRRHSRSSSPQGPTASVGSSYSVISTPAQTPGEELATIEPRPIIGSDTSTSAAERAAAALRAQALGLVASPAQVMTFTSPGGHVHMLRQLAPQLVYVEEKLAGLHGEHADQVKAWVGQVVVVVGGAGSGGLAGLVDTEDEGDAIDTAGGPSAASSSSKWWQSGDMVGLGKGIEVVDATRLQDDWQRRITGRD